MMPELGSFLLCLALAIALLLSIYPQWGAARQDSRMRFFASTPANYRIHRIINLFCSLYGNNDSVKSNYSIALSRSVML